MTGCAAHPTILPAPSMKFTVPDGDTPAIDAVKVIEWPITLGFLELLRAVVPFGGLTVCATPAEVLKLKEALPPYEAVSILAPLLPNVRLQLVAGKVITQVVTPSPTVIVPVGAPA